MLRFHRKSKGFTLIELMIVVAIIGILAAIAIPRFANLIDRAREASTQGNLGALRSALAIYYGSTEGNWPATLADLTTTAGGGPYIDVIPDVVLPGDMGHTSTNSETTSKTTDTGEWGYDGSAADGEVLVNCNHTDSGGDVVNTW